MLRPFGAYGKNGTAPDPRATPWAHMLCPFGAQKWAKMGPVGFLSQGYALG